MENLVNYINLENDDFRKIKLEFSLKTIEKVDQIVKYHNQTNETDKDAILIDIFGLLQSLFVGIDALYAFTIELTNSKSYININQNDVLNHLKHIRNDVVGHPINRKFGTHSVGYSYIKTDDTLRYDNFEYIIYIKNVSGKVTSNTYSINLNLLKESYLKEKENIINNLDNFVSKKLSKSNIYDLLLNSYSNLDQNALVKIRKLYNENYGNLKDRFNWRINLLETIISCKTNDSDLNEIIEFLKILQINKLIEINNDVENRNTKKIKVVTPKIIKRIYKYLDANPKYQEHLRDLHDVNSPYFGYNLNYLLENCDNSDILKVLNLLNNQRNRNKIYLIGSIFNNYYKKLKI